jgi:hypothetical protein
MLFDYFKRNKEKSAIQEHLGGFQDDFSYQEKTAIMCSLLGIATADQDYDGKEKIYMKETALLLGYPLKDNIDDQINQLMALDRDQLFSTLNGLTKSQKDWYIVTVLGMVHADGVALEVEFQYAFAFFERMDITVERCEEVMEKTRLLSEMFM